MNHLGLVVIVSVLFYTESFLLGDIFQHGYSYHGHSNYNYSSLQNGDIDQSPTCDHPDSRDHIYGLLAEWHKHGDDDAIMKVYEWTVTHEKSLHSQVLGKRENWEAYNIFNHEPNVHLLEWKIKQEINSKCRQELIHTIERYLNATPQSNTVAKTTRKVTTKLPETTTILKTSKAATTATTTTTTTMKPSPVTTTTTKQTPKRTTTTAAATTTTKTTTTTTQKPNIVISHVCDGYAFATALAKGNTLTNPSAGLCTDGTHSQSEALLLDTCGATAPATWKQGPNVVNHCQDIPPYTPIGMFTFGHYPLDGNSLSGIFVECTEQGFKMALQLCGQGPQVYEIQSSSLIARQNARNYFVIDW